MSMSVAVARLLMLIAGLALLQQKTVYIMADDWDLAAFDKPPRLRGVSGVSDTTAWVSGTGGTVARTIDGGKHWQVLPVAADAKSLDFRDVDAIDARTAYALSIGNGASSRIYKTIDGGRHWRLQYTNHDPKAFFDAMTFADATHGVVMSDSVDGQFVILLTRDGGATWTRVPPTRLPPALPNEGAFAASGSNIATIGRDHIWIGTGAADRARVLRSSDGGRNWQVAETPLRSGPSSGIFSIAFRDARHGVIVGGDYKKENEAIDNVAFTEDGGVTWTLVRQQGLLGFRSAVTYVPMFGPLAMIAVGPQGSDISSDDGHTWAKYDMNLRLHAFTVAPRGNAAWGAGELGHIVRIKAFSEAEARRLRSKYS